MTMWLKMLMEALLFWMTERALARGAAMRGACRRAGGGKLGEKVV
jgi:hypothetical protein